MHYSGLTRHYLTVSTPGGRDYISVRTEYDKKIALEYVESSKDVIYNDSLPEKMSDKPEYYECKWCAFQEVCHFNEVPAVNCKTCKDCKPAEGGCFYCDKNHNSIKDIFKPCDSHIFKPCLIPLKTLASDKDYNLYKIDSKKESDNDVFLIDSFTLKNKVKNFDNLGIEKIRSFFDGEIVKEDVKTIPNTDIIKGCNNG
jgi:hypothetical protein